tara:strand:- start:1814 stop:2092 length:279 start_codon:yes stop_codon:yes gene_type:complete
MDYPSDQRHVVDHCSNLDDNGNQHDIRLLVESALHRRDIGARRDTAQDPTAHAVPVPATEAPTRTAAALCAARGGHVARAAVLSLDERQARE